MEAVAARHGDRISIGSLPAGGAEIPTLLSDALERRLSKTPEQFGRGAIEGVAGPEAANNASAAGTLVPLLTLGLPTSATAAVMLAAFQQYGLQPGPRLFAEQGRLVWALIASLYIGNVMLLVLNLPLLRVWVNLLKIPKPLLYAGILTIASLGGMQLNQSVFDVAVMYLIGLAGYAMRQARAAGARRDWRHPGTDRGTAFPPRAGDRRRQPAHLLHPAPVVCAAGRRGRPADHSFCRTAPRGAAGLGGEHASPLASLRIMPSIEMTFQDRSARSRKKAIA